MLLNETFDRFKTLPMALALALAFALAITPQASRAQSVATPVSADAWRGIVAAARKEGRVMLYTSHADPITKRMKEDFGKLYPDIALETARYTGGVTISRVEQERTTGSDGADVTISADTGYFTVKLAEGLIKAPVGPSMETFPQRHLIRGAIPIVQLEVMVMAYNTRLAKTPVAGYRDLLRPELKAKIGLSDLGAIPILAWYDWLEKAYGQDFVAQLARQQPRFYAGAVPTGPATGSGEIEVSGFANLGSSLPLIEQGAPIKIVVPRPAFAYTNGMSILGWSKRPNAAQVFTDYLTSVRGQTMLVGRGEAASVRPGIPGALEAPDLEFFDPTPYNADTVKARTDRWKLVFKGN